MPFDLNMPLCFIDAETTGLDPEGRTKQPPDQIVELAAARIDPKTFEWLDEAHVLVLPTIPVPLEVRQINGYDPEVWATCGALKIREALAHVLPLLEGAIIVGQNPSFDVRFLREAHNNAGRTGDDRRAQKVVAWPKHDYHVIDVASLAYPLARAGHIQGLSLRYTRKLFGLPGEQRHTARQDVRETIEVFASLLKLYGNAAEMAPSRIADWAAGPGLDPLGCSA